jgi:hypothetical protein
MNKTVFIKLVCLAVVVIFYLVYTIRYAVVFNKNEFFTGRKKTFHAMLIWLVPFIWILLLKNFLSPIPGSHVFRKRTVAGSFSDSGLDGGVDTGANSGSHDLGGDGGGIAEV